MKKSLVLLVLGFIPFLIFSQTPLKAVKEKSIDGKQQKLETNVQALNEFANRKAAEWQMKRAEAEAYARQKNIPIIYENDEGTLFELQYISDFGIPMYYKTDNVNCCSNHFDQSGEYRW